ncbi:MAG: thiamine biosynthesis protein ThiJ [Parcubacteria group bacterium]|nr:thiamine biosynthesis protein ThiJ [Parcubacteria group bacterium]|tara:strand:- start:1109 stop:1621 length:513 start_codon:yes stop_codon:yes gene_type:complete
MSKKVVFIVAQNNFRDEELLKPKEVLIKRKIEVKVATKTRNKAKGKLGTEISPDLAIPEILVKDFDAVAFVGGAGAVDYFNNETVLNLAKDFKQAGKIVGAICIAPSILANAGLLISKTATSFPSQEQNLRDKGADYTGMPVEVDGKIVTAKGPEAALEFGEELAYLLEE